MHEDIIQGDNKILIKRLVSNLSIKYNILQENKTNYNKQNIIWSTFRLTHLLHDTWIADLSEQVRKAQLKLQSSTLSSVPVHTRLYMWYEVAFVLLSGSLCFEISANLK